MDETPPAPAATKPEDAGASGSPVARERSPFLKRLGPAAFLTFALLLAFVLRWPRLEERLWFAGDQGRAALVVRSIVEDGAQPLLGPHSLVFKQYYGPAFYYLNVPAYALMRGDPRFGAATQTVFGLGAVLLAWYVVVAAGGSSAAAAAAALLLATGPVFVWADITFWNPNLLPFFCIAAFRCAQAILAGRRGLLALTAGLLFVATQLHAGAWPVAGGIAVAIIVAGVLSPREGPARWWESAPRRERIVAVLDCVGALLVCGVGAALWLHASRALADAVPMPSTGGEERLTVAAAAARMLQYSAAVLFGAGQLPRGAGELLLAATAGLAVVRFRRAGRGASASAARRTGWLMAAVFVAVGLGYLAGGGGARLYSFLGVAPLVVVVFGLVWGGPAWEWRRPRRLAAWVLLAAPLVLIAQHVVISARMGTHHHPGEPAPTGHYATSRRVVRWIADDADGAPFALCLCEGRGNSRAYLRYLLLLEGVDCVNPAVDSAAEFDRPASRVYVVLRPAPDTPVNLAPVQAPVVRAAANGARVREQHMGDAVILAMQFTDSDAARETVMRLEGMESVAVR